MTSQLIDLVNTTNNIVFENLQKLNSKFKKIQKDQILNEEEEYDSLNCKINIYFTTFIEQMKIKFILATQEYEKKIEQNNKDILDLMMENMLLKIEKDSLLEEKKKNDICLSDYIDLTIQKEKNSINPYKNCNNMKKVNIKKKSIKTDFEDASKNNNLFNNIYNSNLLDFLNKNGSKKKNKVKSCNKFNNNNYNFNFISGNKLDLNHYHSQNKINISYNTMGKALYESQDNINYHKNKNSFSLNDFRKIQNAFSQKRTKKNSYKKNRHNSKTHLNDNNKQIINKNKNVNDAQNVSFRDNKMQFTEPSYNERNKKKEKINFYCIKKIKEEMNEILKNKKSIQTSNNNSNNHMNSSGNGNMIDNSSFNKIKLPIGYGYNNYYPKNKNNANRKNDLQNKTPKNFKTHLQTNLSEILISDSNENIQSKINYIYGNNGYINQKISPYHKKQNIIGKSNANNYNNINLENNIISNNNKKKDLHNNYSTSALKNLKRNNYNSKSYYKLTTTKKMNINNNSNKKSNKDKNYLMNNCYYNDNINNNISYNLGNKNGIMSRNYSNYGTNYNNYNTNYSNYSNNNFKTINNFNKMNSNSNFNIDESSNNNIKVNNDNAFSMKINNKINLSKNRMSLCLNRNNNNDKIKKNMGGNILSSGYLLNNNDNKKVDLKKFSCLNDENNKNNKNETPSFYFFKK